MVAIACLGCVNLHCWSFPTTQYSSNGAFPPHFCVQHTQCKMFVEWAATQYTDHSSQFSVTLFPLCSTLQPKCRVSTFLKPFPWHLSAPLMNFQKAVAITTLLITMGGTELFRWRICLVWGLSWVPRPWWALGSTVAPAVLRARVLFCSVAVVSLPSCKLDSRISSQTLRTWRTNS